jgi:hypothetical protein
MNQATKKNRESGDETLLALGVDLDFPISQIPAAPLQMYVGDAATTISSWHVANRDATSAIAPVQENRQTSVISSAPAEGY